MRARLDELQRELAPARRRLGELREQREEAEIRLQALEESQARVRQVVTERLVAMYRSGEPDPVAIMLSGEGVVQAFECGAVVNPEHLKNQIEGAIVQGIGGALFETLEVDNGRVVNGRFSKYRVPRFSDAPPIEVVLVDRKDLPSAGSGETPIVGIAPALANAYASATGKRIRSLPMFPVG